MKLAEVLLCLAILGSQVDNVSLHFYQDSLIIREGSAKEVVPLEVRDKKPPLSVLFRRNKSFAVWDERGLTVRIGKRVLSTYLPEVAVSPRIFAREEILRTISLIRQGKRSKNASALSGSKRIGNTVYFLARWVESGGATWLEALVSVDLTDPNAKPKLVAKLPGRSMAARPLDDQLGIIEGKLSVVVDKFGEDWGVATFDTGLGLFVFQGLGQHLKSYTPINVRLGAFVEDTDYGTSIAGRVDWITKTRKDLVESKASLKFVDGLDPLLVVETNRSGVTVTNTVTGAEVRLPPSSALRRTTRGVAVWSPYREPKHAWLYDPTRWDLRAEWSETPDLDRGRGR